MYCNNLNWKFPLPLSYGMGNFKDQHETGKSHCKSTSFKITKEKMTSIYNNQQYQLLVLKSDFMSYNILYIFPFILEQILEKGQEFIQKAVT